MKNQSPVRCLGRAVLSFAAFLAASAGANLLVNGDFEAGNTSFTTDYALPPAGSGDPGPGYYAVVSNPNAWNGFFATYGDHTSGNGLMLIVDSATTAGKTMWRQTVAVSANAEFKFSFWAATPYTGVPATLQVFINGQKQGSDLPLSAQAGVWQSFEVAWNSGVATQAVLELRSALTTYVGNDVTLDDLSFEKLVTVSPPTVLVDGSTPGYYNDALGTLLDGTAPQFPLPYPGGGDPTLKPAAEPNLAAAASVLGNWLVPTPAIGSPWRWETKIPSAWALNTETAIIYLVDGGANGLTGVRGDFDADNGLFVWVNGQYKFGAVEPGLPSPAGQFEYTNVDLGNFAPGTNYIQILRQDNGIATGYQVRITAQTGATNPPAPCPSDAIAWWKAEDNATDALGAHDGTTPFGMAYATGKVGRAFDLDGSFRRVSVPDSAAFKLTNAMTFEAWVYPRQYQGFITFRGDNRGGLDTWTLDAYQPGYVNFQIDDATNGYASVRAPLQLNEWQHVAATWDRASGNLKIYVNGTLGAQTNTSIIPIADLDSEGAVGIGNHGGTFHQFPFNGLIDELAIYARALSAGEIAAIYNAGSAGKCPAPPVAAALPIITNFAPKTATNGATVVLNGQNFSPATASNIVYFGAVRAQVTAASATSLTVTVPPGATYGPPSVTVAGLTGSALKPFVPTFDNLGAVFNSNAFAPKFDLPAASQQIAVAVGDLDGDGRPDVVTANVLTANVSVYRNLSDAGALAAASFAPRFDLPTGTYPYSCVLGDVDGDGRLDLIVANNGNGGGNTVSVFRNLSVPGSLTTASFAPRVNFTVATGPTRVAVGDLDNDGRQDLAVITSQGGGVSVLRNTGVPGTVDPGTFAPFVQFTTGPNSWDVKIGDLDGDGKRDLVASSYNSFAVSVLRNVSTPGTITSNSFAPKVDLNLGTQIYNTAIGDLDGDGKPDLAVTLFGRSAIALIRNLSVPGTLTTGSFATPVWIPTGSGPRDVTLGDVDGDGRADIVACAYNAARISVLRNQAVPGSLTPNSFAPRVDFVTTVNPAMAALGDLNGDGRPDIVNSSFGSGSVAVLKNMIVPQPPLFTQQPVSQTIFAGDTVTFDVRATGTPTIYYQWWWGNTPYRGSQLYLATQPSLTLPGIQKGANPGYYWVTASNSYGVTTSTAALLTVVQPQCTPAPDGLVGWWQANGNALDSAGTNHGTLLNGTTAYFFGKADRAFLFDGLDDSVRVPASSQIDVGPHTGFTIEGWINPDRLEIAPILAWNDSVNGVGVRLWHSVDTVGVGDGFGNLFADIVDTAGNSHRIYSQKGVLRSGIFQHFALTYDKTAGVAVLYSNGAAVRTLALGAFEPRTISDLQIGQDGAAFFKGLLDEISLYNRALSTNEIAAIYAARGEGKCPLPPTILAVTPPGAFVNEGASVNFTATATGSPPLAYQWQFNSGTIPGATNATLALSNVVFAQAGNYTVVVTGPGGTASSNAVLAINRAPLANAGATEKLLISPNGSNAVAVLDGSLSSDPDGDALSYTWFRTGETNPLASGVVAITTLPLGTNPLTLVVHDGMALGSQNFSIEVITTSQAVDRLVQLVQSEAGNPQPLIASLRAALAAIDRSQPATAINQLEAFKNKVLAQVMPVDPDLAAQLLAHAQSIIDALNGGPATEVALEITAIKPGNNGHPHLNIRGRANRTHVVEMSTDLRTWTPVGVARQCGDCDFEFEDAQSQPATVRFYRAVSPK